MIRLWNKLCSLIWKIDHHWNDVQVAFVMKPHVNKNLCDIHLPEGWKFVRIDESHNLVVFRTDHFNHTDAAIINRLISY